MQPLADTTIDTATAVKLDRRAKFLLRYLETKKILPPYEVALPVSNIYAKIVSFLAGDPEFRKPKGLLLFGPTGCGKTTLVRAIKDCARIHLSRQQNQSGIIFLRARRLCEDYTIDEYFLPRLRSDCKKRAVIIDDLGIESPVSRYGTPWGLEFFLEDRYETWEEFGFPTIITTNYQNPKMILERYGERAMSRLVGMVDCVPYSHGDRRLSQK